MMRTYDTKGNIVDKYTHEIISTRPGVEPGRIYTNDERVGLLKALVDLFDIIDLRYMLHQANQISQTETSPNSR